MRKQLLSLVGIAMLSFSMLFSSCADDKHFITDSKYMARVDSAFTAKMDLIGEQFYDVKDLNVTEKEEEALKFLYAYMSVADATDYPTSFYLENVRQSFETQKEMSWGKDIPEYIFRHFVLPIRVNNENLDSSRVVFYNEIKPRIEGKSMYDAILEVNHWCHEKVTYVPSDGRTTSPLASIRNAYGRCGEESTFTVAALRAMGIPARQVYTPRWAHTDDNHAWVEAWADGKWYFLGACEPEPVLNLGWFNAPASRALLMHTRCFGDYTGPEEVMLRTSNFTEINLIDNYGSCDKVDFEIVMKDGSPAAGAQVDFKIYNYAEFYTAVRKYTVEDGTTFLSAGKGDMLVWASKDGYYGYAKASFGKDKKIKIVLDRHHDTDVNEMSFAIDSLDIVPPAEHYNMPEVTPEQRAENDRRFAYEDSIRHAYMDTFLNEEEAKQVCDYGIEYIVKSSGNHKVIADFLNKHKDNKERALALLATLSDKDLKDILPEILEDNFGAESDQLNPRVELEHLIIPYKQFLAKQFTDEEKETFRNDPSKLVEWVKNNIRMNPDKKALRMSQTPISVWKSRVTDDRSRDIFFVALARSLNIESRKDVVTYKVQYKQKGKWIDVDFDAAEQVASPKGKLILDYKPTKFLDNPKYYSHFTISRINDGKTAVLNFEEGQVDMGGGVTWQSTFKNGAMLDEGTYVLVTGTRLASGSVLSTTQIFNVYEGKKTKIPLDLRTSDDDICVIGNFNSEDKYRKVEAEGMKVTDEEVSILSQTGRGYYVIGILGVGQEPTNHALNDIAKVKKTLDEWGRPMVLLFESEADANKFKPEEFGKMPEKTFYGIDNGSIRKEIATAMKLQQGGRLPIFIIADTFNRVVFVSQGYTIGLGEQLERVINKL